MGGVVEKMSDASDNMMIDVSSLSVAAVLPKHVAFKNNEKLLSAEVRQGYNYLEFSGDDDGNERVWNEVHPIGDGKVCIKSKYYGSFWRRSPNWIWGDSKYDKGNLDTVFYPIKLSDTEVALRNLGNNNFCKRLITTEGKVSCLNAGTRTITKEARLKVVEVVLSREVYDFEFDLSSAKIYNVKPINITSTVVINNTNHSNDTELTLSHVEKTSRSWKSQVSFKLGVTASISSGVPVIEEAKVEIGLEMSEFYEWGETKESSFERKTTFKVTVPGKKRVTVYLLGSVGTCDVPFTCTQKDLLINGQVEIQKTHGVYTGINSFNFRFETNEEPL